MPTEHEFKYVISESFAEDYPQKKLLKLGLLHQEIMQGYLAFSKGMSERVRCVKKNGDCRWVLTFKQKVNSRVVEVERELSERDGQDLWSVSVGKLQKDRYVFEKKFEKWEIDFFMHHNQLYFLLAEVELEEGAERPKVVPDFLKKYILYEVPLTDDRFSNKRLGDVTYARGLYNELLGQEKVNG